MVSMSWSSSAPLLLLLPPLLFLSLAILDQRHFHDFHSSLSRLRNSRGPFVSSLSTSNSLIHHGDIQAPQDDTTRLSKTVKVGMIEKGLARARASIRRAVLARNHTSSRAEDFIPSGAVYRNDYAFHQLRANHVMLIKSLGSISLMIFMLSTESRHISIVIKVG